LEPTSSHEDIIRRIGGELRRTLESRLTPESLTKKGWEFLKRWEVLGVRYHEIENERRPDATELLDELTHTIERTLDNIATGYDGVLVLIDEADKPSAHGGRLGEFLKTFTERLTKRGCNRVAVGIAGLSTVLRKLRESHASSPRILEHFELKPLLDDEREYVIRRGLKVAEEKNGFVTDVEPGAVRWISHVSEGYPHFIQQIAYCAFEADTDNYIDEKDVANGALRENGAFQQLGAKYFHDLYFDQIASDKYRAVLQAMAPFGDDWISKAKLRELTGLGDSTMGNAIHALKERRIIISEEGKMGSYRLPTKAFAVWIGAFTQGGTFGESTKVLPGGDTSAEMSPRRLPFAAAPPVVEGTEPK
jgi:hypothetical protein